MTVFFGTVSLKNLSKQTINNIINMGNWSLVMLKYKTEIAKFGKKFDMMDLYVTM